MTQAASKRAAETAEVPTVTLTINGQSVKVTKGTTVLEAANGEGIHIPTFCWHPKLKPVGACRICYVEIEKLPKLQVSCATEAVEGMVVFTESDQVRQGRKAVLEFTLANHPLDCPTCDKGGECDLQDVTFDHGVDDSRFYFRKNRFLGGVSKSTFDDLRLGPEIILNRNRCILCYKCVRANKEAFGEYDLGAFERGNITEINVVPGEQVDNPFSGNLVEICPVGALTNTDWRYKIRVWLTKTTPSICNFSSSGVNILFNKEDHKNRIFRVTSRQNDEIDDGWLADITRYGYQIVNSPDRLLKPLIKKEGKQVEATWSEALTLIHKRLCEIKDNKGSVCIGGLAGPTLDNRSLYTFTKFFRTVLKSNNVDFRTEYRMLPKKADSPYAKLCASPFRIADIDGSDVIVVFGSDLLREHQNEYLRIRKAYDPGGASIITINPYATKAGDVSELEAIYKIGSDELAVHAVCLAAIEEDLVDSSLASGFRQKVRISLAEASAACGVAVEDFKHIARTISGGKKISFIIGEIVSRSGERETIAAALCNLNLLFGLSGRGQMAILARYANSRGAELLGIVPQPHQSARQLLEQIWGEYPDGVANNTDAMLALTRKEEISGMIVMGLNPVMLYPDGEFVREGLERLEFLVACDLFETKTTELADVVLPLCSWTEYDGDYVNLEGRVQRASQAIKPCGQSRPGYEIISSIAEKFGNEDFSNREKVQSEIDQLLRAQSNGSLPKDFIETKRVAEAVADDYKIPMLVCDDQHHSGYLTEKSPSLVNFSGESYIELSPGLAEEYKLESGDSVRVESPVGKIIVPARISEHIENDVVLIASNFSSTAVNSLLMRKQRIDRVKLSKVDD